MLILLKNAPESISDTLKCKLFLGEHAPSPPLMVCCARTSTTNPPYLNFLHIHFSLLLDGDVETVVYAQLRKHTLHLSSLLVILASFRGSLSSLSQYLDGDFFADVCTRGRIQGQLENLLSSLITE